MYKDVGCRFITKPAFDGQRDRRTDTFAIGKTALHTMQRGNEISLCVCVSQWATRVSSFMPNFVVGLIWRQKHHKQQHSESANFCNANLVRVRTPEAVSGVRIHRLHSQMTYKI